MERAKPTTEQSLVVRSPQSWLSEDSFGAAQPQAGMMEEDGACWQQRVAEEFGGAHQSSPPTQPTQLPACCCLDQQPTASQSLLMEKCVRRSLWSLHW